MATHKHSFHIHQKGGESKPEEKAPSRLKKHAPTKLQVDRPVSSGIAPSPDMFSNCAIPLLSPLILSPPTLTLPEVEEDKASEKRNGPHHSSYEHKYVPTPPGGWQHPAITPMPEPASLLHLFNSQCVVAHQP
uniref:Uncharacterized protein n=1 Tax=Nelumbo nucifera TaxID=4432 RepID=A0A822Y4H0_NELNU|nr:TPA_asm: hypothetical protein HUJ06_027969 [Nelumbo nucifera]